MREVEGTDTLHSTMFSINRVTNFPVLNCCNLYIPPCFLLIGTKRSEDPSPEGLYIPPCFLLISDLPYPAPHRIPFTFHHVFY